MGDTKLTKSAGEQWVCSVLARLGWAAALTRDGVERTDILAVHAGGELRQMVEIQVKTVNHAGPRTTWPLGSNAQKVSLSDREWFVLVWLPREPLAAPRAFVVPRDHVAAASYINHMDWFTEPGVPAGKRNTPLSQARVEASVWMGYEDRWDLLLNPTSDAPVLLPAHYRDLAQEDRVGLPPGHPWCADLPLW